jgi:hypothetical protein
LSGAVVACALIAGCASSSGDATPQATTTTGSVDDRPQPAPAFVGDVRAAIDAVEDELGSDQRFFEVTANAQFANVFVAVDGATAALPFTFVDGVLQPPAPKQVGAEGETFARADVSFDPALVVAGVEDELPETSVDAISVYGDGVGATYVLAATSPSGGFLDIVVGPEGRVLSVDPV